MRELLSDNSLFVGQLYKDKSFIFNFSIKLEWSYIHYTKYFVADKRFIWFHLMYIAIIFTFLKQAFNESLDFLQPIIASWLTQN